MSTEQWLQVRKDSESDGWLPVDILIHLIQFISVKQRIVGLTQINKSFSELIYSPQCFQDLWIVPIIARDSSKKMKKPFIRIAYKYGRWCIVVNYPMRHPFICKVVEHLNRWYLASNELNKRSKLSLTKFCDPFQWLSCQCSIVEISINCDYNNNKKISQRNVNILSLPNSNNISHLFLSGVFNMKYNILFPRSLLSLHLHSFGNNLFSSNLWKKQIFYQNIFISIEYLSIYKCEFDMKEIQYFSKCIKLSILELVNVSWKGTFYLSPSLKSIRFKAIRGKMSFKKCNQNCNNLIECIIPTLSKSIFNVLRNFTNIQRLVLFSTDTFTLSHNDYYHFSDPWNKHKQLKVIYNEILQANDQNLQTNLKIVFPFATLISTKVLIKNDYKLWKDNYAKHATKYIKMLKAFNNNY